MNKIKTTKKSILEGNKAISIGYCCLQHLLYFKQPFAYNSGRNGWNCDFYQITLNTIISTGYSPCGTTVDYTIVEKYDGLAQKIISNREIPWDDKKSQVNNLLEKFVKEV
jgi:hypothetical protein